MNESTRRLKLSSKKLGSCIDKARPYYEALEKAKTAQLECQAAAIKYQRANEIHAAAKETVALAEQRFMSNSHEWQFDNAWQEMLNHATIKVSLGTIVSCFVKPSHIPLSFNLCLCLLI